MTRWISRGQRSDSRQAYSRETNEGSERDANRCADTARFRTGKTLRRVQNSAASILVIILLGICVSPQSVPNSRGSADDLAQRVITNELRFQDDQSKWMYRLEKEQYGKKRVEEIIETREGSVSRLLSMNERPLTP
jgi:hypothetical protein